MWASVDTENLALQRHDGARYFGVIQVIDFCNGKVTGDQLPPESSLSKAPERGNVIHGLLELVDGNGLLPSVPHSLVNSWRVADLVLLISTSSVPLAYVPVRGSGQCSPPGGLAGRDRQQGQEGTDVKCPWGNVT